MPDVVYRIQRASLADPTNWSDITGDLTASPTTVTGQGSNVAFWVRVKKVTYLTVYEYSVPVFVLMLDIPAPVATGGLGANHITISWPTTCANTYRVYKYHTQSKEYLEIAEISELTLADYNVSNGPVYFYYVVAILIDGDEVYETNPSSVVSASISQGGIFAMLTRASQYQNIQVGLEATAGTLVPTTLQLFNMELQMTPEIPLKTVKYPGSKAATDTQRGQEHSEGRYSGVMDYNLIPLIMSSMFGYTAPTIVQTLGWQWDWTVDTIAPRVPNSVSIEQGSSQGAEKYGFGIFNELVCRFGKENADIEGSLFAGKQGRNATMTPNVKVTTTAAALITETTLAVTAVSAAIADNTVLLFTNGTRAVVNGAVAPAATSITVDALPGGILSGESAYAVPELAPMAVDPYSVGVYLSLDGTTWTTRLEDDMDGEIRFGGSYKPKFHVNDLNESFDEVCEMLPDFGATLTVDEGTEADDFMQNLYDGQQIWLGYKSLGPLIETGPNLYHLLQMRMPVFVTKPDPGDKDGSYGNTFSFECAHNSSYGLAQVSVVNKVQGF